ncbi:MAG: DUF4249 family protein [Gemmatimonadetes bacterium]|nr:DUF4249 family protein [Gemmatimonadota bacterium]MYB06202.1 DUF4249 family protein [Gemmatimonadota bacterium]MYE16649.1 DUF4249 family protein [Gemmatimonadota bacterium]MYG22961.1 DUF4249 family protein [Gemmatimonadota bacterium]MYJ37722.1 DUF4249 family protein [Gemmatimonadota bacterium]
MKTGKLALLAVSASLAACSDTTTGPEDDARQVVVEAFLFAGEPVDDIRLTRTVPLGEDPALAATVDDAIVTLTRGSERWLLNRLEEPGAYGYPDDDLQVRGGDLFRIEVEAFGRTATGETIVPGPPDGVQLDKDSLAVPELTPGSFQPGALQSLQVTVSWENAGSILHFVDVEGLDPAAETIFPDFIREGVGRFRIRSAPTEENFHAIGLRQLEHLGRHRAIVYRVNQEYAELYNNRVQDSRDLNEPPSNIRGGLGVFSAFNSVAREFDLVRAGAS